ncbi:MAG: alkaline phosphatase family protein [Planctomycetia bacterium]|nr:alkaline phosphatase family protein [Planctomycetia bacterium]
MNCPSACLRFLLGSALLVAGAVPGLAAEPKSHVVIINVDGFAAYLLDDPKAPIPTIRRLAKEGALAVGGMKVSNPSVTWPNHTSLVTGVRPEKHGVLANGVLVRGGVDVPVFADPKRDQAEMIRTPTLFDVAHRAGLATAEINWPCTRGSKTLDDSFPDVPDAVSHSTPRLIADLVKAGILADATDATFKAGSMVGRDLAWTEAACYLIRHRMPNLLLLHLLNCDSTQHADGPQTPSGYTANAYADTCVAKVVQALDDAGLRAQTTIFIVADHGFTHTPKALRPHVLLRNAGLLKVGPGGKVVEARINVFPEGGIGLVYCNDPGSVDADRKKFVAMFTGQEGVAEVLEPAQFAEHGLPHPREYAQAPDLILVAKDGYGVSASAEGETLVATQAEGKVAKGTHGFLAREPKMNAICIVSGRGIQAGSKVAGVENIDVAPTAAKLLGLTGFTADGKPLDVFAKP